MSDCQISLGSDDYDSQSSFSRISTVKARKEHRCCECRRVIQKGEEYDYLVAQCDGFFTAKTCLQCAEIRAAFVDGAMNYGDLWEEMREYGFDNFNEGCLAKLETSKAKQLLVDRWRAWKGLSTERPHEAAGHPACESPKGVE